MKKLHQKLLGKSQKYQQWHAYEYHPHHHWLVVAFGFIFGVYVIAGAWQVSINENKHLVFDLQIQPVLAQAAQLIFNSGFEAGSQVIGNFGDISGVDSSVSAPNDWDRNTWDYDFNYVAGSSSQRKAEIVDDPTGGNNKVLHFWLREAPLGGAKGARTRVTAQIHTLDRTEWFSRRRVYVHPDFLLLSNYSGGSRVMFEEIKVNRTSATPNFRITLVWSNVARPDFTWEVEGEELRGSTFWAYSSNVSLPIGEWFTAETYYKAGDNNTGRYVFAIQRDGQPREVIFDVSDWTRHPDRTSAPAETWNPQKLYMSRGGDVDHIRNNGGAAQLYFDDWEVWSTMPSGGGGINQPPNPPSFNYCGLGSACP